MMTHSVLRTSSHRDILCRLINFLLNRMQNPRTILTANTSQAPQFQPIQKQLECCRDWEYRNMFLHGQMEWKRPKNTQHNKLFSSPIKEADSFHREELHVLCWSRYHKCVLQIQASASLSVTACSKNPKMEIVIAVICIRFLIHEIRKCWYACAQDWAARRLSACLIFPIEMHNAENLFMATLHFRSLSAREFRHGWGHWRRRPERSLSDSDSVPWPMVDTQAWRYSD